MKRRNLIFLVAAICTAMILAVSCTAQAPSPKVDPNGEDGAVAPEDAVRVSLVIDEDKNLSSDVNRDIKYWEFMATPKFTLANGEKVWGKVSYWRVLDEMDTDISGVKTTADLGRYTSGDWYFEVRALNSEKHVLYIGSKQQVIREGLDNIVHITMLLDRSDDTHGESADSTSRITGVRQQPTVSEGTETIAEYGRLHVGIELNKLDIDPANISISVYKQAITKESVIMPSELVNVSSWTRRDAGEPYTNWFKLANSTNYREISGDHADTVGTGRVYYECMINGLDAGPYKYTFIVNAKNTAGSFIPIAGQSVNVTIVGNEETLVKGTLLANEYVQNTLKLKETGKIYCSINGMNYMKIAADGTAELSFGQTEDQRLKSKEVPVKYYWIKDGQFIEGENGSQISLTCPVDENGKKLYGIHRVSMIAVGELGSLGNATIDVIFNPPEGPGNWWDFDWSVDSDITVPGFQEGENPNA